MRLALASIAIAIASASASTADAAPPKLAAHIAPMFQLGRTWTYDISLTTWNLEAPQVAGKPPKQTSHDVVTCKVASVDDRKGAVLSHVTCDKADWGKLPVAGYYVGNAKGMSAVHPVADSAPPTDDEIARALAAAPTVVAAPRPFRKITREPQSLEPVHNVYVTGISTTPGGWCLYQDTSDDGPDGGKVSTCYVAGIGIASGTNDVGGELNDFRFTARK